MGGLDFRALDVDVPLGGGFVDVDVDESWNWRGF
jgi:hypothetical protein